MLKTGTRHCPHRVIIIFAASLKGNPQQEGARGGEEKTPQHALTNEQATLEIEDEKTPIEGMPEF